MNLLYFFRNNLLSFLFITLSTLTWSQTTITSTTNGNWSNAATWVGGVVPVLGDNVVIAAGHTVTLTIGVNIGTGNLTVSGEIALAGFNLTAGSLSGDGNIGSTSGTPTLSVGSNNSNTTFSGIYSGVGANLAKEGTGVLTLSGLNTYTGTTNIRGTISISNIADGGVACNLGQASSSSTNIRLNGGGILYNGPSASTDRGITQSNTSANSIEVANGSSLTINGAITGEGVSSGQGKLILFKYPLLTNHTW